MQTIVYIFHYIYYVVYQASLVAQMVKCLPTMRETWVRSLNQENPLEKEMATHSSTLAWKIYSLWGHKELDTTERLHLYTM